MDNSAFAFATKAHEGQKYGGAYPYTHHLDRVVQVLMWAGFSKDRALLNAGWLHDTLEDQPGRVTYQLLWDSFGLDVANLVKAVTDKPGKNRREKHEATYPGIRRAGARAVALKLADRIANVEFSVLEGDEGKLEMYRKEHADFTKVLYQRGEHEEMWDRLGEALGFEREDQLQYSEDDT